MNAEELFEQAEKEFTKSRELEQESRLHHRKSRELRLQASEVIALEVYGLKPGDRIEVTQLPDWSRGKTMIYTVQIESFWASSPRDKTPYIIGKRVLKSGELGVKEDTIYPSNSHYSWRKLN